MSFERHPGRPAAGAGSAMVDAPAPGKQTLTGALDAIVQRRVSPEAGAAEADGAEAPDGVHAAAALGTSGPTTELPHRDAIQRAFGRHDVGHIKAHVGGAAEAGASAMGAEAFATGDRVAFRAPPDLRIAAHEAAHVIQQRAGVQLSGGVGEDGDAYEEHADEVAEAVVQGRSAEALLDQHAGGERGGAGGAVQRYAFVAGRQIKKSNKIATGKVGEFVKDEIVRSYKTKDELADHAAGSTDYLGNLDDGTWLRFHAKGLNVLGENHTLVTLTDVLRAVGSTSFITERFATDDLADGSQLKTEYESEAADRFQQMGIDKEPDKKKYGAESLFPKIGYAMADAIPYFDGTKPIEDLTTKEGYSGKPLQRYLKLGWAHAKDLEAEVAAKKKAKQTVSAAKDKLCKVVVELTPTLDGFITGLPHEGFLGDAVVAAKDDKLLPRLLKLANAIVDVMFERALDDPSSGLDDKRKKELGSSPSTADKFGVFADWRDHNFAESVKKAAADGVRYAGMGAGHLYALQAAKALPKGSHDYDMSGDDLDKFQDKTRRLAKRAKKQ